MEGPVKGPDGSLWLWECRLVSTGWEGQIPPGLQVHTGTRETQVTFVQIPSVPSVHVPAVHGVAKSQTQLSN